MTRISRRELLLGGSAGLFCAGVPWFRDLAHAQGAEEHNLIVVFASGGWDVTSCFDPKPDLESIDVAAGDVRMFGDLPIWVDAERSAVTRFFTDFGDVTTVVNGIEVRSIAHEECTKRILTGTNSDARPDIGSIFGEVRGNALAVPYMVLGQTAFAGKYGGSVGRAGTAGQIFTLLDESSSVVQLSVDRHPHRPTPDELSAVQRFLEGSAERHIQRRAPYGYNRRVLDDYRSALGRREQLKSLGASLDDFSAQLEIRPQMELATTLLREGISRAALVQTSETWDTHNDSEPRQNGLYQDLFDALHGFVVRLREEQLFAKTTILVVSEMGRTPKLNQANGKDHWPVTSAMLIGPKINGGKVFGGTDEFQLARPIDLTTGLPSDTGRNITAASFIAGVLEMLAVDPAPYLPNTTALRGFFS